MFFALEPNSRYEARVQARNEHGWSKFSDLFVFSTRATGGWTATCSTFKDQGFSRSTSTVRTCNEGFFLCMNFVHFFEDQIYSSPIYSVKTANFSS
jgi:hypothetical protein